MISALSKNRDCSLLSRLVLKSPSIQSHIRYFSQSTSSTSVNSNILLSLQDITDSQSNFNLRRKVATNLLNSYVTPFDFTVHKQITNSSNLYFPLSVKDIFTTIPYSIPSSPTQSSSSQSSNIQSEITIPDHPTTCSSAILKDFKPGYESTVVERVRTKVSSILSNSTNNCLENSTNSPSNINVLLTGKTNMDEFGMGLVN
jgi:hypothetical protein